MESLLEIRNSRIAGKGVFAKKSFHPDETICFMQGEVISLNEMNQRILKNIEADGDSLQIDQDLFLDLFELYRLINHSCEPNAYIRGKNELVALKEIKMGGEITYDYSTTMWEEPSSTHNHLWTMKCLCGASSCRKIICEFYELPPSLQNDYLERKIVPDFILKKSALALVTS